VTLIVVMGAWADFETWYRRAHPRLLWSLSFVCGDADLAREITDEACVRALDRWERVSVMSSPDGWTYRVALNLLRRRGRRAALERTLLARQPVPPTLPPPAVELWDIVRSLPERQRKAVVLRYVADLPENEIAEVMGIARGTVAATLRDARQRLAPLLADTSDDEERSCV
jgi:RNA polymerase sigma-70 factor (ECF subfamily)